MGKGKGDRPHQRDARNTAPAAPPPVDASSSLLATKLFVPHPQTPDVRRHRLLAQLDRALSVPLTLVIAPPGYGKTNLLTTWIAERSADSAHPPSFAWLSLDRGDNDLPTFVRYLVAACQRFAPTVGATTLALLQQPAALPPEALLAPLVNDLAMVPNSNVLVLEDAHLLINHRALGALAFLLEHLPPQVHLVLASREDPALPIARLRAMGRLVELHSRDLRFTAAESGVFLRDAMGVELTDGDVAALEARTEGWAAGLQLAALALRERPRNAGIIQAFSDSSRYLVDYLTDEVLDRLPPHLKTFALQTAILERLCGPLCDAVLGVSDQGPEASNQASDSYSQLMLEELERRQLFLVALDDKRGWYRYHQLFADLLRERLERGSGAARVATLHERASRWYEEQGLIEEAMRHALAAGAPTQAARMVEQRAEALIMRSAFTTLQRWLALLPETLVYSRRRLALALTAVLLTAGDFAEVERLLQAAERAQPPDAPAPLASEQIDTGWRDDVAGISLAHRSMIARSQSDLPRAIALGRAALEHLPARFWFMHAVAGWNLGMVYLLSGDLPAADQVFDEVWRNNATPERIYAKIVAAYSRAHILLLRSRLHAAADLYYTTLQRVAALGAELPAIAMLHIGLADVLYEWNDLQAAAGYLSEGLTRSKQFGQLDVLVAGHAISARVHQAQGRAAAAAVELAKAEESPATGVFDRWSLPRARAWLAQGNIAAAERWATRDGVTAETPVSYQHEPELVMLTRVLLQREAFSDALRLLDRLTTASEAGGQLRTLIEVLVLKALAHQGSGDQPGARASHGRALRLAEGEGYVRVFVDEGAPMAALLRDAVVQGIAPTYGAALLAAFHKG